MLQFSVIIPVLQEQQRINQTIAAVRSQFTTAEIIVVDGDPAGSTLHVLTDPAVIQLSAPAGRGSQLAAGVAVASGDTILLLHADTLLPDHAFPAITQAVSNGAVWGAFRLGIDAPGLAYRTIEQFVDLRCNLFTLPYGDQAIFVARLVLQQIGGIPLLPLMEDVALCDRLKHSGHRFKLLPTRVQTSARRWQRDGVIRRTLHNWWLLLRYRCGYSPETLTQHYR